MACSDPNCTPACNCSQCCPPTPPPIPPTPPPCDGEDCVEIYDAACVIYTGPDIECVDVQTNDNLNTIIQVLAAKICDCCTLPPIPATCNIYGLQTVLPGDGSWSALDCLGEPVGGTVLSGETVFTPCINIDTFGYVNITIKETLEC